MSNSYFLNTNERLSFHIGLVDRNFKVISKENKVNCFGVLEINLVF